MELRKTIGNTDGLCQCQFRTDWLMTGMAKNSSRSVLLVEDHQELAETVGSYLEATNYIVDYAGDGLTAMHLGVTNTYDAIVLDIMLPGVDGLNRLSEAA